MNLLILRMSQQGDPRMEFTNSTITWGMFTMCLLVALVPGDILRWVKRGRLFPVGRESPVAEPEHN